MREDRRRSSLGRAFCWLGVSVCGLVFAGVAVTAPKSVQQSRAIGAFLSVVNADRAAAGVRPLARRELIEAAASRAAEIATDQGAVDPELLLEAVGRALEDQGYDAGRLQVAVAQMGGPVEGVVKAWKAGAPATFDALAEAEFRDFGLGIGFVEGVPFYVVAVAVRAADQLAGRASELGDLESVRREILRRVNAARSEHGLMPVQPSQPLDEVAQAYAEDMWRRGYFGHESPEGQDVMDRVKARKARFVLVGENVASGQPTASEVMDGWLKSPGHRANLLGRRFTDLGVGVATGYREGGAFEIRWVQVFGQAGR